MIKRSEMTCDTCEYAVATADNDHVECRESPTFRTKYKAYWCSRGLWRVWSTRFHCWTHYYLHEGDD